MINIDDIYLNFEEHYVQNDYDEPLQGYGDGGFMNYDFYGNGDGDGQFGFLEYIQKSDFEMHPWGTKL